MTPKDDVVAVVRPNVDQLPGACCNWFTAQRWVDVSNNERGVTRALDSQTLYSCAQNNHWNTNYKTDQPGMATLRYVVRPHVVHLRADLP